MARVDIRGVIIPNNYKFYYDYWGEDSTCPRDVKTVLDGRTTGETTDVYISSPGGVIDAGSEIYTMLREADNVKIHITGEACSAASIIAMAGWSEMSPTALMMVHCVSTYASGNHSSMEHTAEVLRTADKALCSAYMAKAGMSEEEALEMMDHETWLTAEQAKNKGLIDAVMFEMPEVGAIVNGISFKLPTADQMEKVRLMMQSQPETAPADDTAKEAARARLDLLKLNARAE